MKIFSGIRLAEQIISSRFISAKRSLFSTKKKITRSLSLCLSHANELPRANPILSPIPFPFFILNLRKFSFLLYSFVTLSFIILPSKNKNKPKVISCCLMSDLMK